MSDDGGCIHPAEESEVPARNEMDHSDFQSANVRQPSLPHDVLAQGADPRCGTSKLAQDGLQFTISYLRSSYVIFSWLMSSNLPPHVLAQVADLRCGTSKLAQDGLQFIQLIPQSSNVDGGWIHPAEES